MFTNPADMIINDMPIMKSTPSGALEWKIDEDETSLNNDETINERHLMKREEEQVHTRHKNMAIFISNTPNHGL